MLENVIHTNESIYFCFTYIDGNTWLPFPQQLASFEGNNNGKYEGEVIDHCYNMIFIN